MGEIKPNGISEVIANEHDLTHFNNRGLWLRHVMLKCIANGGLDARLLEQSSNKGDIPVCHYEFFMRRVLITSSEKLAVGMPRSLEPLPKPLITIPLLYTGLIDEDCEDILRTK